METAALSPPGESVGAEINLVGSLSMGLLMTHRDIDFHIYTSPLELSDSFGRWQNCGESVCQKKIECANLLHTVEECVEWHAWFQEPEGELWQIDMIHIRKVP